MDQQRTPSPPTRRHRIGRRTAAAGVAAIVAVGTAAAVMAAGAEPGKRPPATVEHRASEAELQRAVDDVVAAGAPGALVLVRHGDHTTTRTSGVSDVAMSSPMTAHLRSRIGGITKSFTASVVLQLAGEQSIDLDDTVEHWLPGLIVNGADISIRQLLNHTSGIFDYTKDPTVLEPYEAGDLTRVFDPRHGVEVAAGHGPQFAPGREFAYSNTNTLLLAMIVEEATGAPIDAQLRQRIFEPLRLHDTSFPADSEIAGEHLHGYLRVDGADPMDVTAFSPTLAAASGAVISSADDVADFYRALLGGELLEAEESAAMRAIDPVATGGVPDAGIVGGGWGLGLLRETFPCGVAWGHDAENPGYMTAAWNSEDGEHQVVVMVNVHGGHDDPVSVAMRELLELAYCG